MDGRWARGLEPPTCGATVRRSDQLSYAHREIQRMGREGLEPPTRGLRIRCSTS